MGAQNLFLRLKQEEGTRTHLYQDSEGHGTIGIGYNIEEKGLPMDIILTLFTRTVAEAVHDAEKIPEYPFLDEVRQTVLTAMVFQMGLPTVLSFSKMRAAIRSGDFELAGKEMLDSRWGAQTPERAGREATIMSTGKYG